LDFLSLPFVGDHVELHLVSTPPAVAASGFGMLKSQKLAVPADFDPAALLDKEPSER
jgi:hypothetical protein